jgi:uncharacterized NAD(P)/FAD-binding protein YdhS
LRELIQTHMDKGGDWRSIINSLRSRLPEMWKGSTLADKKRFLRHVMPYWNIHRHRVHHQINNLLESLVKKGQLKILSGRVMSVNDGIAKIRLRHETKLTDVKITWLINCMGPGMNIAAAHKPLAESLVEHGYATLDPLKLGFAVTENGQVEEKSGTPSDALYSLGPPTKGIYWECTAVPDIRKQSLLTAKAILKQTDEHPNQKRNYHGLDQQHTKKISDK